MKRRAIVEIVFDEGNGTPPRYWSPESRAAQGRDRDGFMTAEHLNERIRVRFQGHVGPLADAEVTVLMLENITS